MIENNFEYIAIEGPIGVGKTSLAKKLSNTLGGKLLLERPQENPFLAQFYNREPTAALSTQLFFLLQRAEQINMLKQKDMFKPTNVADFLIDKDKLFATATLNDDELGLYHKICEHLLLDPPTPNLVIYLQANVDILMERIEKRGRPFEKMINYDYVKKIAELYIRFFHHYDKTNLLILNTERVDFAKNEQDYIQLLNHIKRLPPGRHYFNPRAT